MKFAIIGTTSWGTTLGIMLAKRGESVSLLAQTPEEAERLNRERQNLKYAPGQSFPPSLKATASVEDACRGSDMTIIAVPSSRLRENAKKLKKALDPATILVSAVKGLEAETGKRMSQLLAEELPIAFKERTCVLSGPNLSKEILLGLPASTVLACRNTTIATSGQHMLNSGTFRVYTNDDVAGVEFGGSLKNIIAIGAGIADGLGMGNNAKASFISRGLAEMTRLGVAAGAHPRTFAGLAGLGDLIATCESKLSRNHYLGEQLAKGRKLDEIRSTMINTVEGVDTTRAALILAKRYKVEMPIAEATYRVLFEGVSPQKAMQELMSRTPRHESEKYQ
ncbi:MAG: NAD(P)-dependent glycerol-3-phosphate dehydrogenase [Dehalococcoidia bacterium]|nr:NAD(P)-dependent glycerol-3-phosphate dehydrogenase [Dehalococcoidia bacterium]